MIVKDAVITNTRLGRMPSKPEVFTFMLEIDDGTSRRWYGAYVIASFSEYPAKADLYATKGVYSIVSLLDILGVPYYESLVGTKCRIKSNSDTMHPLYISIGNQKEEKWFSFSKFYSTK